MNEPDARPMPVFDIPVAEAPYWDALDARVTCDDCSNKVGPTRCLAREKGQEPAGLPHNCGDHSVAVRRPRR